jgi:hypothetical protein
MLERVRTIPTLRTNPFEAHLELVLHVRGSDVHDSNMQSDMMTMTLHLEEQEKERVAPHLRRVRDDHARPSGADVVHGQMITATLIHHAAGKVHLAAGVTSLFSDCGGGAHGCRVCMDRNGAALAEPTSPCQS